MFAQNEDMTAELDRQKAFADKSIAELRAINKDCTNQINTM